MNEMYRRETRIDGERKRYSHYVWYQNTGHWPSPDEVVHHIDEDRTNDSFDNLRLMSDSEHKSLHARTAKNSICGRKGKDNVFFGKTHTEETKAKQSASKIGEKNPNWQGDDATPREKRRRQLRAQRRAEQI